MLSFPPWPAWLLGGPDEGVIDGLDNEVEMQGILHQVLGVAPLQVGVRQEVTGLLAALVEAVGVADQQAAVVARPTSTVFWKLTPAASPPLLAGVTTSRGRPSSGRARGSAVPVASA